MSEYFPQPKSLGGRVKFQLDLSNYATKTDLKNATGADTSSFLKKTVLANLKSDVDKSDIDKLVPVPVYLSKLSDEVKYNVARIYIYIYIYIYILYIIHVITNLDTNASVKGTATDMRYFARSKFSGSLAPQKKFSVI